MNNDILPPPQRPNQPPERSQPPQQPQNPQPVQQTAIPETALPGDMSLTPRPPKKTRKKVLIGVITAVIAIVIIAAGASYLWYTDQLRPVDSKNTVKQRVEIKQGMTARSVATMLKQKKLIRSTDVFYFYAYIHGKRNHIEAGVYSVAPGDSTPQVVDQLTSGKVEQFSVTFYPGGTIHDLRTSDKSPPSDVISMLKRVGYSQDAIDAALSKSYSSPLFAGKPAGTTLEGYIYGDTYAFDVNATPSDVLERTFQEFETVVKKNDLVALYQKQGLTLYQGITLASIIQREVASSRDNTSTEDQKIVAQIFLSRLKANTTLGSDVTYQYSAAMRGVAPSPDLDSPYNTRKYPGLPPGPISSPGLGALLAVAHPASTDYTFFLSGDDGKTYFAHTDAEHQANIAAHCQQKCSVN